MSAIPRTVRGRITRERILSAATELVAARGVAATSLEDVRAAAHASNSQLYLYFTGRDELMRAVAQETCDQVMDAQAGVLSGCDSIDGIRAYFDAIVAVQAQRQGRGGCRIGTLVGQLAETDERAREALSEGMSRWEQALRAGLVSMAQRGDLAPEVDPTELAGQILALVEGGLLLTQIHRDPSRIRIATDGALELISQARRAGA